MLLLLLLSHFSRVRLCATPYPKVPRHAGFPRGEAGTQHPGNNVFALPFDDASRAPRTSPGPQRNTFSLNPTSTIIIPVPEGDCGSERLRDCPKVTQHMSSIYKNMNQLTEHFLLSFGLSIHPSGGKKISWPGKNTGVGCHFLFQCMKVRPRGCSGLGEPRPALPSF